MPSVLLRVPWPFLSGFGGNRVLVFCVLSLGVWRAGNVQLGLLQPSSCNWMRPAALLVIALEPVVVPRVGYNEIVSTPHHIACLQGNIHNLPIPLWPFLCSVVDEISGLNKSNWCKLDVEV